MFADYCYKAGMAFKRFCATSMWRVRRLRPRKENDKDHAGLSLDEEAHGPTLRDHLACDVSSDLRSPIRNTDVIELKTAGTR